MTGAAAVPPDIGLTGFDLIEHNMAFRFAERADGWPVGPITDNRRAYSCATPSVQIIELATGKLGRRFIVLTLFPFLRTDRRYLSSPKMTLYRARLYAIARLRELAGGKPIAPGPRASLDLWSGGKHVGLESRL